MSDDTPVVRLPAEIRTSRLLLRTLDPGWAAPVLAYFVRNDAHRRPWSPTAPADFHTLAFHQRRLQQEQEAAAQHNAFRWWMFPRAGPPDLPIGHVSCSTIVRGAFQSCYLGYELDEAYVNQGYMTEAVAAVVEWIFGVLRLHRIEANIMPRNARSLRVVAKLGFIDEGLSRRYMGCQHFSSGNPR